MAPNKFENKLSSPGLAFQPLYKQVEQYVTQLIVEQRWRPGEILPSEFELAAELGVSQGTVRKALSSLTNNRVLTRRQGVGTFVSEHTGHQALFRFFPLLADGKGAELPKAELLHREKANANSQTAQALELKPSQPVVRLLRRRLLAGDVCMYEHIFLPHHWFAGVLNDTELPHTLYHYYQTQYQQTVHTTQDRIKAVIATAQDADLLGVETGSPLLEVRRVARTLDGRAIEFRISRCRSDNYHYLVELD